MKTIVFECRNCGTKVKFTVPDELVWLIKRCYQETNELYNYKVYSEE